ncbi:MAG: extracellular solute-binding protein [Desulfobacterales bacterium]|nr:extracellular solute-binding protein [Desulfobacterales bacterium]
MCIRKSVTPCLMFLVLLGFMIIFSETARADALRDEMIARAKTEKQIVIGGGTADQYRDSLVNFRKMYPFITVKAFVSDTATTVNRIVAEAKAGRASIDMVNLAGDALELLAEAQLLQKVENLHLNDFYPGTQPNHGYYVQQFIIPRVQGIYNTDLVSPGEVPRSWEDMADPKWAGKTMISRSAEEIPSLLAFMWGKEGKLDWDRAFDFFTKLEKQKPIIARGMRGGNQQLAAGETAIFWFSSVGPSSRMHFQGAPVGLIAFPKFPGPFRSSGIIKNAQNPAAAWLFIDYLSSPQGQYDYTDLVSAELPLNKKAEAGKLTRWVLSQGGTIENAVTIPAEFINNKEVSKKSEDFFLRLLGIR